MWRQARNKCDVLNTGLVYNSVIGCAVACIIRLVISLVRMNIGFSNDENELCNQVVVASIASYTIVHLFVVIFLWSRQRSFFANKLLNFNYSRPIRYFSSYVIIFIVPLVIFSVSYYSANTLYTSDGQGCIQSAEHEVQFGVILVPILSAMFYNVSLFGLFFYTLTHAKSFQRREAAARRRQYQQFEDTTSSGEKINKTICSNIKHESSSFDFKTLPTSTSRHKSTSNAITSILQRTLIFAIISIFVDVLLQLINTFVLSPNSHRRIVNMGLDLATFLNLIFVILSFAARKDMITSPCKKH